MTNYYDIVKKLIGEIEPIGETNTDNERFENLKEMTNLVNDLIMDIQDVSEYEDRGEYSMHRAGKHAEKFLGDIVNDLNKD
jgi:hypothetical protein